MTKQLLREDLRFIHSHWDFYIGHELSSLPFRGERTKNKWSARKEDRGSMNGSVQMNKRTDPKKKKKHGTESEER